MNRFSRVHPAVAAVYFASVLAVTVFAAHPVVLVTALLSGLLFFSEIHKPIHPLRELKVSLPLFLLVSLTNPLFSHSGVTPLFFINRNPITLEALLYGVNLAVTLLAAVYWFRCLRRILTEDKLLYLCGTAFPKLSLLMSSAVRLIPLLKTQSEAIRRSQRAMGLYASDSWTETLRGTARSYSALVSWALENAVDTGSSMKARGYGLKGRSCYSLYTFRKSDAFLLSAIAVLDAVIIAAGVSGQLAFSFYPSVSAPPVGVWKIMGFAAFALLSLMPFVLEVKEDLQWKYYRSGI